MKERQTSRRNFLKNSAVAVAAPTIITSTALGTATTLPASERITVGHIGVGGRGRGRLSRSLQIKDAQVVAISDCFKSRRENSAKRVNAHYAKQNGQGSGKGCSAYLDYRELIARDDIDAVVIATPDHQHIIPALAAARSGKDMYVEKPLGLSMEENKALRKAINRYGNVFQYGTQQRSSQHCRFGCELVLNGRVGKISRIVVDAPGGQKGGSTQEIPVPADLDYDRWLGPIPVSPYTKHRCTNAGSWFVYDNSLGFLGGWGAHPLDIAQWGNGSDNTAPVEYEGTGVIPTEGLFNTVTNWNIRAKYANGVEMLFKDGPDKTTFFGDDGWVAISRGGIDASDKALLKSVIKPDEIHLIESKSQMQNFYDSVKSRAATVNPIESAIRSDTISHLSDIAIRVGRKVRWDAKKEVIIGDPEASRMLSRPMREPYRL